MNSVWTILFSPLVAAAIIALVTRRFPRISAALSVGAVMLGFVLSVNLFLQAGTHAALSPAPVRWLDIGTLHIEIGAHVDQLSILMLLVVTGVGSAIHVFSLGYMKGDAGFSRYFACLSLFVFSMLGIVLSSNFVQMFLFWELVGLSSYLLIGFWYERSSAADAAKKALLTNRVGDFGFMLGILLLWTLAGTLDFAALEKIWPVAGLSSNLTAIVGLLIFCGAVGKSAQLPLHVWLPDAMEGPTPVSALIHAATMVAAGVYMMCRLVWLIVPSDIAMNFIAWTGGITAIFAALIAVAQSDIKRILAYSTLSQLGYMMMAVGLNGTSQAMFHLTTHAFFKALLFLSAGSVIHALHHEQDIWKMGGLSKKLPMTFFAFLVGTLALAGFWPLSGFYSKDAILLLALDENRALFIIAAVTAFLTAFYMGRAICLAFLGKPRDEHIYDHAHESPLVMIIPLIFLAVLSVIGGWGNYILDFIEGHAVHEHHSLSLTLKLIAIPAAGLCVAAWIYLRANPSDALIKRTLGPGYTILQRKFYIDELYELLIALVQGGLAWLCDLFDRYVIQRLGLGGLASGISFGGRLVRVLQNGQINFYAFMFGLGAVIIFYLVMIR